MVLDSDIPFSAYAGNMYSTFRPFRISENELGFFTPRSTVQIQQVTFAIYTMKFFYCGKRRFTGMKGVEVEQIFWTDLKLG